MRNIWSVAASVAVVVLCGCQNTHVDQVRAGDGMRDWYDDIKSNYPGFRPPRLISPGVSGQTGPAARNNAGQIQTAPADISEVEALPVDPVPVPEEKPAAPAPAGADDAARSAGAASARADNPAGAAGAAGTGVANRQGQISIRLIQGVTDAIVNKIGTVYGNRSVIYGITPDCNGLRKAACPLGQLISTRNLIIFDGDRVSRGSLNKCQIIDQITVCRGAFGNREVNDRTRITGNNRGSIYP